MHGISYDSRKVHPGDTFVAIPGAKFDGYDFIPQAIQSGAKTIVAERDFSAPANIKKIIVSNARQALAELSNEYYDYPSRKLKLIGITGTNGKTTIAYLIESILKEAGYKTGLIGTVETKINGKSLESILTTPESLELQALLSQMLKEGVTHVVMEVSSHSLAQNRVFGCEFDAAIFTNLTHDHLDFHKTMGQYLDEKKKLFKMLKPQGSAIINVDDPHSKEIASVVETEIIFYGVHEARHELRSAKHSGFDGILDEYHIAIDQMRVKIDTQEIRTQLIGEYNVYNILAAYQCGLMFKINRDKIKKGIESAVVPGRLERIENNKGIHVFVDFAHSPDALEKLLKTLKPFAKKTETEAERIGYNNNLTDRFTVGGRLILVFGCPGDRDREKRPMMGKIAAELADEIIVTTDDPHTEDPQKIIDEVLIGISHYASRITRYLDRKQAIEKALSLAIPRDIVVIAGRGHEKYQDFNGKKVTIDDRDVVREFLK